MARPTYIHWGTQHERECRSCINLEKDINSWLPKWKWYKLETKIKNHIYKCWETKEKIRKEKICFANICNSFHFQRHRFL